MSKVLLEVPNQMSSKVPGLCWNDELRKKCDKIGSARYIGGTGSHNGVLEWIKNSEVPEKDLGNSELNFGKQGLLS